MLYCCCIIIFSANVLHFCNKLLCTVLNLAALHCTSSRNIIYWMNQHLFKVFICVIFFVRIIWKVLIKFHFWLNKSSSFPVCTTYIGCHMRLMHNDELSPNGPTGPIGSSSRNVHMSICMSICPDVFNLNNFFEASHWIDHQIRSWPLIGPPPPWKLSLLEIKHLRCRKF